MGSWNGTCGISQLPIHSGDDIMVYIITEATHKDGGADYCYSTGYWHPVGFPFKAKYNDYGSFEDVDEKDTYFQHTLNYIKDRLVEVPEGRNSCHDIKISKKDFDLDLLKEGIHEGRLSMYQEKMVEVGEQGYTHIKHPYYVGQFMIHKHIWDTFSEYRGESYGKKHLDNSFKLLRKKNEAAKNKKDDEFVFGAGYELSNVFGSEFIHAHKGMQNYFMEKKIFEETDFEILYKMICINGSMSALRKGFVPQTGAGSQSEAYSEFRRLNKAMQKIMKDWDDECNS